MRALGLPSLVTCSPFAPARVQCRRPPHACAATGCRFLSCGSVQVTWIDACVEDSHDDAPAITLRVLLHAARQHGKISQNRLHECTLMMVSTIIRP